MYETWDKRFGEIFIRAATALYCEQLESEAMAHAMLAMVLESELNALS